MLVKVNELERAQQQTLQLDGDIAIRADQQWADLSFHDFQFTGQAVKKAKIIEVNGMIAGVLHVKCSRCLQPFEQAFSVDFAEQFVEGTQELDDDIHVYEGIQLDLFPYLSEVVFLNLPQIFVCMESCKGLCPTCGKNQNEESCSCKNERIDPRLADLALFFSKKDNE